MASVLKRVWDANERELARYRKRVAQINDLEPEISALSDTQLAAKTEEFRERLADGESLDDLLPEAFAVVREAANRAIGERPFDVQLIGAMVLHDGKIAEMKTGEGKTLTATMPLYLNALEGKGAHLVTTNDFLVKWQAQWMGRIYEAVGMTAGYIQHDMQPTQRREMYECDITYVQNSELGFDYLRDNMTSHPEHLVLRDLHYAIVDEVDSILIDEARTPLIISGMPMRSVEFYEEINRITSRLRGCPVLTEQEKAEGKEPEGDYEVDEKYHQAALTEQGQAKVEKMLGIDNLSNPEYLDIAHHINASLKAHALYKRDVHYVVKEGEVVIVDEFTGHLQPGRRYSDGLHQAIEAKEGVRVQQARQTVASITYQNFFRIYDKLAGMTGTAKTEEAEFYEIYRMPVVVVPTNEPVIRVDHPDVIYKTQEAKYRGIVSEIINMYVREQPVLVGTRSVDVSEYLSSLMAPDKLRLHCLVLLCQERLLNGSDLSKGDRNEAIESLRPDINSLDRRMVSDLARQLGIDPDPLASENIHLLLAHPAINVTPPGEDPDPQHCQRLETALNEGIPHNVLNAKYHEQEGRIIAEAGAPGAVTIATNMAGRGVDIVLGGKSLDEDAPDPRLAQKVKESGGLHILGTERHESRRIDNQLRGRSGRQGDPGSSRFYISLQDELMRLFGPERFGLFMRGWPEEEAIEHRLVTRSLETAQAKVEMRNFQIRKNTLKYDDVMNKQRSVVYEDRRKVLLGEDFHETILEMFDRVVTSAVSAYASPEMHHSDWDLDSLYTALQDAIPGIEYKLSIDDLYSLDPQYLTEDIQARARELYEQRTAELGPELVREIERSWLLRTIDLRWMEHLQEMDYLREAIHLRAYGQRDPLIEYQKEAFDRFDGLLDGIAHDMVKAMLLTEVVAERKGPEMGQLEEGQAQVATEQLAEGGVDTPMTEAATEMQGTQTYVAVKEPGRNDPCPCGSGKKYKKCCMNNPNAPWRA